MVKILKFYTSSSAEAKYSLIVKLFLFLLIILTGVISFMLGVGGLELIIGFLSLIVPLSIYTVTEYFSDSVEVEETSVEFIDEKVIVTFFAKRTEKEKYQFDKRDIEIKLNNFYLLEYLKFKSDKKTLYLSKYYFKFDEYKKLKLLLSNATI